MSAVLLVIIKLLACTFIFVFGGATGMALEKKKSEKAIFRVAVLPSIVLIILVSVLHLF